MRLMVHFAHNEAGYLDWLSKHCDGLVANTYGSRRLLTSDSIIRSALPSAVSSRAQLPSLIASTRRCTTGGAAGTLARDPRPDGPG